MSLQDFVAVKAIKQAFTLSFEYSVLFTRECFALTDSLLIDLIDNRDEQPKILAVLDQGVADSHPQLAQDIVTYCQHHQLECLPVMTVPAGEACKNDETVIDSIYQAVETHQIDRHSYILVIGGGAVVDAIGFAAATAHRGIRLIRMPSTVLGQNDAGVGVKNAINYHKRKNFIGTFAPPFAVINDFALLDTLEPRDKRAGIAEAVKVALIKDASFFQELFDNRHQLAKFERDASQSMIVKCAQYHLNHIASSGDPYELGSARPLDFGHWSAHKLEELSNNALRHGEAVAIGIALDSLYSSLMGHIRSEQAEKIVTLLQDLGFELAHPILAELDVNLALADFKEHLGGNLCITLLDDIGHGFEANQIDEVIMKQALQRLVAC